MSPFKLVRGRQVRGPLNTVFDSWWERGEKHVSKNVKTYMQDIRENFRIPWTLSTKIRAKLNTKPKNVMTNLLAKSVTSLVILC